MKERFKAYLEEQFRQIAPTKAAMEYRKSLLIKMLDRAQDLRIKGMSDDELIYNTVVGELGDFAETLRGYENRTVKRELGRRMILLGAAVAAAWIVILAVAYLIVGFVAHIWHPTWLIIVGGTLLAIMGAMIVACVRLRKNIPVLRALVAGIEVLISVTVFLFLQLVGNVNGSWMTFLAMVALIACTDTAFAFASGSKFKWIELPVCIETVCVMLYVILGIGLGAQGRSIWHPAWLMCLGGVAVGIAEIIALAAKRASEKKREEREENTKVNEAYWTEWDD